MHEWIFYAAKNLHFQPAILKLKSSWLKREESNAMKLPVPGSNPGTEFPEM